MLIIFIKLITFICLGIIIIIFLTEYYQDVNIIHDKTIILNYNPCLFLNFKSLFMVILIQLF